MNTKILIVEDEFVVANTLRLTLLQAGYTVTGIAASAKEADALLQKQQPDFVLLDIQLNGKGSGIDLAWKLKERNIAFIYLSANSSQKVLEKAKATDPYGFLLKPFREKDLLVTLDIASYRKRNAMRSRLQQESLLQKTLENISKESIGTKEKLLKVARAMRAILPFDLMVMSHRPEEPDQFADAGYLRVGFDEYQFIGGKELMTIAALSGDTFSKILRNSYPSQDNAGFTGIADQHTPTSPLQQLWLNCFKINSSLLFSVMTADGLRVTYSFHNREPDIYKSNHVQAIKLIEESFTALTSTMIDATAAISPDTALAKDVDLNKAMLNKAELNNTERSDAELNNTELNDAELNNGTGRREFKGIIGKHALLLSALDFALQVAPYNTSVLLLGESGTGKEKVAQAIHQLSPRKDGPFIEVNCGAIPATLIESELFGHEKGAFTGATEKRKGRFEQAEGGTVFLDEIGELPLDMQVKLLRVLQEREINYVGNSLSKKVDVRIVAATNRNLEKEVAEGNFRLDLYYRLNVFPITLPPLRERKSDIEALANFFAQKFCLNFNKKFKGISASMIAAMLAYHWPGNIRELENVIERSVILNGENTELQLMQHLTKAPTEQFTQVEIETLEDVKKRQREIERDYLIAVLKKTDGRIRGENGAAELLNLKPTTLESRIAKLGVKKEDYSGPALN